MRHGGATDPPAATVSVSSSLCNKDSLLLKLSYAQVPGIGTEPPHALNSSQCTAFNWQNSPTLGTPLQPPRCDEPTLSAKSLRRCELWEDGPVIPQGAFYPLRWQSHLYHRSLSPTLFRTCSTCRNANKPLLSRFLRVCFQVNGRIILRGPLSAHSLSRRLGPRPSNSSLA